jgi:hypothetical protein
LLCFALPCLALLFTLRAVQCSAVQCDAVEAKNPFHCQPVFLFFWSSFLFKKIFFGFCLGTDGFFLIFFIFTRKKKEEEEEEREEERGKKTGKILR